MKYYRLEQLILKKYGNAKFTLGCELVAQWMNTGLPKVNKWQAHTVINYCSYNPEVTHPLTTAEASKLMQLFGLQRVEELFTQPEATPDYLKILNHQ
jgi:hypothetical protein